MLLIAAAAMVVRMYLSRHRGAGVEGDEAKRVPVRRAATLTIGLLGGAIVGMTSVGSGSLMIVALMLLYPTLSSKELVGTDLVQAVPLVLAAAIGHLIWGEFELGLTGSLLIGSVPGVIIGAHVSSRAPDAIIRPILVLVLTLSALKLLDVPNEVLAAVLAGAIVAGTATWFVTRRRARALGRELPAVPAASAVTRFSTRLSANTPVRTGSVDRREPRDPVQAARVRRAGWRSRRWSGSPTAGGTAGSSAGTSTTRSPSNAAGVARSPRTERR